MSHIRVVSASAGSGKTYRLVQELVAAITDATKPVRPEAVIATTFTNKAAAELRERVRAALLERGMVPEAQQLAMARIGTVNAVCAELIQEYAFELGLAPEVRTLEEDAARTAFERSLSELMGVVRGEASDDDAHGVEAGSAAARALHALEERMPGLAWQDRVREIVDHARANRIDAAGLRDCAARSARGLLAHLPGKPGDPAVLREALLRALEAFVSEPELDSTKTTAGVVETCNRFLADLRRGRMLAWTDWAKLAKSEPGAKSRTFYEPVAAAAQAVEQHPQLFDDIRTAIMQVFELAAQALDAYQQYKAQWGLLDFVDQECHALELLQRPHVRDMLAEQLDLVLVDEFQDTSPLQLELFLALASIAPRSVWVGDQKQAIYGFRGTDPALMDATVAAIEARGEAGAFDTLPYSWRSRAPLVRLTSSVFAPAFASQGIAESRVRLEPSPRTADPDTLGHAIEVWRLQTKRKDDDAAAVASGVVQLLADTGAQVRDVVTGAARHVQPGDVAVLCRRNRDARRMAAALESLGVPAVLGRPGLAATLEGRVVLAALRLWVDKADTLAAAELGRIVSLPTQGDAWLQQVLETDGRPFQELPQVAAVFAARTEAATAGVMAAFDAAVHAVGARELCLRWGSPVQRLANLDRLRSLAARYTYECAAERETPTVAGLVAHLGQLQADEKDEQATPSGQQAVTVSTLHGAKGLEWPVTILFAIDRSREPSAFDVHVMHADAPFSFEQPLAGRWIRYWPDPFAARPGPYGASSPSRGSTSLHAAAAASPEQQLVENREARENLRLLYVGWTRARDRVVLASREGKLLESGFNTISGEGGALLLREPDADGVTSWAGQALEVKIRSAGVTEGEPIAIEPGDGYVPSGPREYAPATVNPSLLRQVGTLGEPEPLGHGVAVMAPAKGTAIGDACHAFFAADAPGPGPERHAMAERLLHAHGAAQAIRAEELVSASTALREWCERRWSGATLRREWPVRHRLADGSELNGYVDMVLETEPGLVVIDHKCLAGSREEALASATHYHGQLEAYAQALAAATGQPVTERWLHLVLQGLMVRAG